MVEMLSQNLWDPKSCPGSKEVVVRCGCLLELLCHEPNSVSEKIQNLNAICGEEEV